MKLFLNQLVLLGATRLAFGGSLRGQNERRLTGCETAATYNFVNNLGEDVTLALGSITLYHIDGDTDATADISGTSPSGGLASHSVGISSQEPTTPFVFDGNSDLSSWAYQLPPGAAMKIELTNAEATLNFQVFGTGTNNQVPNDLYSVSAELGYDDESGDLYADTYFLQAQPLTTEEESHYQAFADGEPCILFGYSWNLYYSTVACNSNGVKNVLCPTDRTVSMNACLGAPSTSGVSYYAKNEVFGTGNVKEGGGMCDPTLAGLSINMQQTGGGSVVAGWAQVASGGSKSLSVTTSWSSSSSTSNSESQAKSFSISVSEALEVKFMGDGSTTTVSADASNSITRETTSTLEHSVSQSTDVSCTPIPCEGILYAWKVSSGHLSLQSCNFVCVPYEVPAGPKAPLGYCSTPSCQCSNAPWYEGQPADTLDESIPGLGGTCVPPDAQGSATN